MTTRRSLLGCAKNPMSKTRAMPDSPLILVADVGGTNARLALACEGALRPGSAMKLPTKAHDSFHSVLETYLAAQGAPDIAGVCVAAAGAVSDGMVSFTNLDWSLSTADLIKGAKADHALLINDLQAQGYALDVLPAHDVHPLVGASARAEPGADGAALMVGIGTGLNAVPVHRLPGGGTYVPPAESGHVTLPDQRLEAPGLTAFLAAKHGFAAAEDALSGRGLEALYDYACGAAPGAQRASSAEVFARFDAGEREAQRALRLFVEILGAYLGDLALITLPTRGIFLVGGMARAIAPHAARLGLGDAMRAKGRFADTVAKLPVYWVQNDDAALLGAARALAPHHA